MQTASDQTLAAHEFHAAHHAAGKVSLLDNLAALIGQPTFQRATRNALSQENYGVEWCLSDLLRLPREQSLKLSDVLVGVVDRNSTIAPLSRVPVMCALELVHGEQLTVPTDAPRYDDAPILSSRGPDGTLESMHHAPSQHRVRPAHVFAPGVPITVPIVNDYYAWGGALWLLRRYGWQARLGGAERRRFLTGQGGMGKGARHCQVDMWQIVEPAFAAMHPDLAPTDEDRARPVRIYHDGPAVTPETGGDVAALRERLAVLEAVLSRKTADEAANDLAEKVARLQAENDALRTRRGPGRPPKIRPDIETETGPEAGAMPTT